MGRYSSTKGHRGMTLIDVLVGTALFVIIFTALFGLLRASATVTSLAKSRAGATAVGESQIEYVRSLTYDSLGTIGGIPSGVIPQVATTTDGGVTYVVHTFVNYADDPADGLGASDTNGISTDYKRVRVEIDYTAAGGPRSAVFVSTASPPSLEATTNGGTLTLHAVNATGAAVPGAQVIITNTTVTPNVNLTAYTDDSGALSLPGAAQGTGYKITVTNDGYSTAQTYDQNSQNVNPNPGHLTVSKNQTTTGTFAIDALSILTLATYSPIATSTFTDSFADSSRIATSSNTAVSGGKLQLATAGSGYAASGTVRSIATTSSYLVSWGVATTSTTLPGGTTIKVHLLDGSGNLIPDTALPGNSAGFSSSSIDLSQVSTTTYPTLALSADLVTAATSTTPQLLDWSLSFTQGPIPLPNVSFTLTGTKNIGTTGAGAAIPKTSTTTTSGNASSKTLSLEWDSYTLSVPSYDIVDGCDAPPYVASPGATLLQTLVLGTHTANMLLVSVQTAGGADISGATVTLTRSGYTGTKLSSSCGNSYFGNLTSAVNYTLTVTKSGYTTQTINNVSVTGSTLYTVTLI